MKRLLAVLILAVCPNATAATASSIILNEPNPRVGDTVTFTAVYPKEATRKVTTVQHVNPDVDLRCYQAGAPVYWEVLAFVSEKNNRDGTLTGTSGPATLGGASRQGNTWVSGAADCYATLYYFGKDGMTHTLASVVFTVAA